MFEDYYEEVGPGWKPLLERAENRIRTAINNSGTLTRVKVVQVKEKFAQLRIYLDFSGCPPDNLLDEIHDAVMEAESASANICEECGEPGYRRGPKNARLGWMKTYCETHHAERDAKHAGSLRDK